MSVPDRDFGPYVLHMRATDHLVITRSDDMPAEPGWYELQTMARMAFGGQALAIEIFPPAAELVDGQNQRHLWHVPDHMALMLPSLFDGRRWPEPSGSEVPK